MTSCMEGRDLVAISAPIYSGSTEPVTTVPYAVSRPSLREAHHKTTYPFPKPRQH